MLPMKPPDVLSLFMRATTLRPVPTESGCIARQRSLTSKRRARNGSAKVPMDVQDFCSPPATPTTVSLQLGGWYQEVGRKDVRFPLNPLDRSESGFRSVNQCPCSNSIPMRQDAVVTELMGNSDPSHSPPDGRKSRDRSIVRGRAASGQSNRAATLCSFCPNRPAAPRPVS
jgi:hypothetical protein